MAHGIEVINSPGGPQLTPARDLRFCYKAVIQQVMHNFNTNRWPELTAIMGKEGVTFEDLCKAMDAYGSLLSMAAIDPERTYSDALKESGWLDCKPAARFGLCAMFGTAMMGQFYRALEEATPMGERPQPSLDEMFEAARQSYWTFHRRASWRLFVDKVWTFLHRRPKAVDASPPAIEVNN